ncbi:MAG TPA: BON domain-containing protein [Telluria sp.]|nr:BON domain-containing protein [Telluria sp.]
MKIAQRFATMLFAASLVATMAGCASTPTKEGTGEYVDDSVITAKVKASIFNEPTLKASEINVETFKGDVQLSGFVANPQDAQKAVEIARGVKGVTSVKNDVRIK